MPYKYTGKEYDPETKLTYYGARYYDAKLSRWISVDPPLISGAYLPSLSDRITAQEKGEEYNPQSSLPGKSGVFNPVNLNSYHYSFNNPLKYLDPDGNAGKEVFRLLFEYYNITTATEQNVNDYISECSDISKYGLTIGVSVGVSAKAKLGPGEVEVSLVKLSYSISKHQELGLSQGVSFSIGDASMGITGDLKIMKDGKVELNYNVKYGADIKIKKAKVLFNNLQDFENYEVGLWVSAGYVGGEISWKPSVLYKYITGTSEADR